MICWLRCWWAKTMLIMEDHPKMGKETRNAQWIGKKWHNKWLFEKGYHKETKDLAAWNLSPLANRFSWEAQCLTNLSTITSPSTTNKTSGNFTNKRCIQPGSSINNHQYKTNCRGICWELGSSDPLLGKHDQTNLRSPGPIIFNRSDTTNENWDSSQTIMDMKNSNPAARNKIENITDKIKRQIHMWISSVAIEHADLTSKLW